MTFRHLEAFIEVARRGGFTAAARALHLTQPTVSGQIRELEDELGVVLFHRLPKGVEPTDVGQRLLVRAREVLDGRDRLGQEAAALQGLVAGQLEVHASTLPGGYLLPGVVARFKVAHPGVRVVVKIADSEAVVRTVADGEADLGVVGGRSGGEDLASRPLWADRIGLYHGSGQPSPGMTVEGLRGLSVVLREEGSGTRTAVEQALRGVGFDPAGLNVVAELGSTAAVKEAVRAGLGAAFLSERAVEAELALGWLEPVSIPGLFPVTRRFYAVWHPHRRPSPAVDAFVEMLGDGDPQSAEEA